MSIKIKHNNTDNSTISTKNITQYMKIDGEWAKISADLDYENIFEEMKKRFNIKPIIHHNCHNCGGQLELREDQHIFICPYCNSVYAVGISQVNS